MLKLEFKNFDQTSYWVVDEKFSAGSSARNELVIRHDSVLEKHAVLTVLDDSTIEVVPVAAAPVLIEGSPVHASSNLKLGQTLTLGEVELRLFDPSENQRKTPPKIFKVEEQAASNEAAWKVKAVGGFSNELISITGDTYVGRELGNDIVLPGNHISRRHARLFIHNGQLMVHDLDSSNGTYVNDERVRESALYLGDRIRFDNFDYQVAVGQTRRPQASADKTAYRPAVTKEMLSEYSELDQGLDNRTPTPLETAKLKVREASRKSMANMQVPTPEELKSLKQEAPPAPKRIEPQSQVAPKANTTVLSFLMLIFLFTLALLLMVLM